MDAVCHKQATLVARLQTSGGILGKNSKKQVHDTPFGEANQMWEEQVWPEKK